MRVRTCGTKDLHQGKAEHYNLVDHRCLTILSKVMATNVDSSLVFLDKVSAHEILSSLSSNPSVVMGCLYDKEGNAFAAYLSKAVDNLSCSSNMDNSNSVTGISYISHIQTVVLDAETVGFLEILIELKLFDFQVQKFALVTFIIFHCTLLIVFLLSKRLNKIIIFPILSLLNLIKKVSNLKNYSFAFYFTNCLQHKIKLSNSHVEFHSRKKISPKWCFEE